jgi:hypothetical protein
MLKLQLGHSYRTRDGLLVRIVEEDEAVSAYPFKAESSDGIVWYTSVGKCAGWEGAVNDGWELMSEVTNFTCDIFPYHIVIRENGIILCQVPDLNQAHHLIERLSK